jgi:hypothetical protein
LASEQQLTAVPGRELDYVTIEAHLHPTARVYELHRESTVGDGQMQPVLAIADIEGEASNLCGEDWIEPDGVIAGLDTQVAALY